MNQTRTLKSLQTQLNKAESDLKSLGVQLHNLNTDISSKKKVIENIKNSIRKLNSNDNITISEHAMLRYLERVKKINLQEIEKEILTEDTLSLIEQLGDSGKFPIGEHQIVLKNGVITTVV